MVISDRNYRNQRIRINVVLRVALSSSLSCSYELRVMNYELSRLKQLLSSSYELGRIVMSLS